MKKVNFKLNVAENKKDFNSLVSAINKSTVLPILSNILVVNNGVLKFSSTDLENFVSVETDSSDNEEFSFCMDGNSIKSMINNSLSKELIFEGSDDRLSIDSGGFKVKMNTQKSDFFPKYHCIEECVSETINSKVLCTQIAKAIKFLPNDYLRTSITGINLVDWNSSLHVVSTDTHRMFYSAIMPTPKNLKGISVIIPKKSAKLFVSMFSDEEITIKIENGSKTNYISFSSARKELMSRLIDCKFPDFGKVIIDCEFNFSLQRKQVKSFIKIAKNFTIKNTKQLMLKVTGWDMSFSGEDMDEYSEFQFNLPIYNRNKVIPDFLFSVNINLLEEALSINKNDEYVLFEHTGISTKGFIIDRCYLQMPLMTNN